MICPYTNRRLSPCNWILLLVLVLAPIASAAQKRPLTVENLKSLVNNGVTEKRLQELVRDRGIAFVPDQDALQSLRAGGVPESVLAELPAQARRDLPAYRQQLYEAGQKEDWSAAASLTKRILFVDPNDREAQSEK